MEGLNPNTHIDKHSASPPTWASPKAITHLMPATDKTADSLYPDGLKKDDLEDFVSP